ncbi:PQQ-dependent sugar dehydrogenase, partial [Oharaeibacter diazotrophicus]
ADPAPAAPAAAPAAASANFTVEEVTAGLVYPWGMAFLPDGSMLVTEKPGRLRRLAMNGTLGAPIAGVPAVVFENQGGLLDVALHPNFARNRLVYFTYARQTPTGAATSLARAKLSADLTRLTGWTVLFTQGPRFDGAGHFGSRIAFDGKGHVFVSLGDRQQYPSDPAAQRLNNGLGKVIRLGENGGIPADNPFAGQPGRNRAIWTYGHRNPQGLAFNPLTGTLFELEHGPMGGDELNVIRKGRNYGWPVVSWGLNYDGSPVGTGKHSQPGMVDSIRHWTPVIAPGGLSFYTGDAFPAWKGDILIGSLQAPGIVRLDMAGDKVLSEERLLTDRGQRIRMVRGGPDGYVYAATDEDPGRILRLKPAP